ncbi:MAG TPA: GTP-dependent dephospho-CoA kinase family protein [Candidatus Bathyarchaeia archaeon]|nr:GTP-dependent dephospho-CoA kinase family protein [Candidatus Bathyarchaeia archaeon]
MSVKPKHTLVLKPELRQELKNPLGLLIKGTPEQTMKQLSLLIQREKPEYLISVGDVVSQNMLKTGVQPHLMIVDGKVMREKTQTIKTQKSRKIKAENPAGTITAQSWLVVKEALRQKQPTQIMIDGEEDLLTLVAVLMAPQGSYVVYGQPHEGIVAVKVDETAKHKVNLIIKAMEPLPKS